MQYISLASKRNWAPSSLNTPVHLPRRDSWGNSVISFPGAPCTVADHYTVGKRAEILQTILKDLPQHGKVLEIGCGLGIHLNRISTSLNPVGIDINLGHLWACQKNLSRDIPLAAMDAHLLGFKSRSFDLVYLIEVAEHLHDLKVALSEIARVLRPDGLLLMTMPNRLFPLETHGIGRQGRSLASPMALGIPILPWLPSGIRRLVTQVEVRTSTSLVREIRKHSLEPLWWSYFMPSMDHALQRTSQWVYARAFLGKIARILNRFNGGGLVFGSTVVVLAKKIAELSTQDGKTSA